MRRRLAGLHKSYTTTRAIQSKSLLSRLPLFLQPSILLSIFNFLFIVPTFETTTRLVDYDDVKVMPVQPVVQNLVAYYQLINLYRESFGFYINKNTKRTFLG